MASLAIGVHAAPSTRALDAAKAIPAEQSGNAEKNASRIALVIGNGHYPADAPLTQAINDAGALTAALRRDGFEVDIVEDASSDAMHRAIDRLRVYPGS
ncbi:MAG: caspase family protein [Bradyrhizobium sp.]|nr:caspase family protein [Bradyrhizobium sp.]